MRTQFSFTGQLCTGGALLTALLSTLPLMAQQHIEQAVEKSARVVERGAHHAKWETVREVIDPESGQTVSVTNIYVQLETGLHYQDEQGQWRESIEEIEVQPGAAVAMRGPHQVRWAANINTFGAIEFWTPEGEAFRSHVLGLAYFDPATGDQVMVGEIQDSLGSVAGNHVVYQDAFTGLSADLRYKYTKGGFVQDIILREKLPDPALWGLDPATVQVQVLTEFVSLPEELAEKARQATAELTATNALSGRFDAVHGDDQTLSFGSMTMTQGRAFGVEDSSQQRAVPVRKALQQFEGGRNILLEILEYQVIEPELEVLPELSKPTAMLEREPLQQQASRTRSAPAAPTRQWAKVEPAIEKGVLLMARSELPAARSGYVIDYNLTGSTNNLTLQGDTTYYITGSVTATGTTTLEGGAVIKFANTNTAELKLQGALKCLTAPYRPAVFTSALDDTVGDTISYSASPTTYYAKTALWIDNFTSNLRHVQIRNAERAVFYNSSSSYPHYLSHVQMVNCGYGVVSVSPRFKVRNALMNNVTTNFHTTTTSITGEIEHLTSNSASVFNGSGNLTLNVTNALLVAVTTTNSYSGAGNATEASASGVFQTVVAGQHYLANGSAHRNAGVTNVSSQLKEDFYQSTTYPPTLYTATYLTNSTVFAPLVQRDTDVPDRGYHYPALDYMFNALIVTNATVSFTNGVCVGTAFTYGYGVSVRPNGYFSSEGKPDAPNRFVQYSTVQEQATAGFASTSGKSVYSYHSYSGPVGLTFRFTQFNAYGLIYHVMSGYNSPPDTVLKDCEFFGGRVSVSGLADLSSTNSLYDRCYVTVSGYGQVQATIYNSTFVGGTIDLSDGASPWNLTVKDSLFDKTTITRSTPYSGTYTGGYNGYITNYSKWTGGGDTGDVVLSASPSYQVGPLGNRYLAQSGSLLNAGSRTSTNAGLYHFTTQVDQTKETTSQVDIGYHYVSLSTPAYKVAYVSTDTTTQGTWKTVYGQDGFHVIGNYVNYPEYLLPIFTGTAPYTWNGGTSDVRALQKEVGSDRIAACLYTPGSSMDFYLCMPKGQRYRLAVYCLDWDTSTRTETVALLEPGTLTSLDSRSLSSFNGGKWLVWDVSGEVIIRVTNTGPSNAVVSGVMLSQGSSTVVVKDTDGDTLPDYFEDANGNGSASPDSGETDWDNVYNSPSGLSGSPALQVYTILKD